MRVPLLFVVRLESRIHTILPDTDAQGEIMHARRARIQRYRILLASAPRGLREHQSPGPMCRKSYLEFANDVKKLLTK